MTNVDGQISVLELITPLLRHWRVLIWLPITCVVAATAFAFLSRPTFTATVSFMPESSAPTGLASSLAGLAGQFGLPTNLAGGNSPDFFASVVQSDAILRPTLLTSFRDPATGRQRPLLDILDIDGPTSFERLAKGTRELSKRVDASVDRKSGIITLAVRQRDRTLAADVANRMVELLARFNVEKRQSTSREQRRFTGERLAEAERELRAAEQEQLDFLQRNREHTAPLLAATFDRLQRTVVLKQDVYTSLAKANEDARIAEVRDTPVLTVVDSATPPLLRTSPRRLMLFFLGLLGGLVLAVAWILLREFAHSARAQRRPDYEAFVAAVDTANREITGALRLRARN